MHGPELTFDFPGASLRFRHPARIAVARRVEDVPAALATVRDGVAAGLFAAGYLAYEAAPAFDPALSAHPPGNLPLVWFGLFDAPVPGPDPTPPGSFVLSNWVPSVSQAAYGRAIRRVRGAIAAGETYQVNYTLRLRARFAGDDRALYQRLRSAQGAGCHARLDLGRFRILSASPELFFRWDGERIAVRPMKGTAPRGRWAAEDAARRVALARSAKDRAENVMIVDMMRSDLGRIAVPGSVRVDELFAVETYPTVHQLTSSISARTRPGVDLVDVFAALFPSASVTGAPKVNTMRWIKALEPERRGVYCGAIGYVRPGGEAAFSVPIRTVTLDMETSEAEYGVGGGVTWDSTREGEYAEVTWKARVLTHAPPPFDLLETLRLEEGRYFLKSAHLDRIAASAAYFGFPDVRAEARAALDALAASHPTGRWRVRLLASRDGRARVETTPLPAPREPDEAPRFALASAPVSSEDPFLFHKTTHRAVHMERRADAPEAFDVLLWNERGEITEFTTGNVALEIDGVRWTPPVESGLLAGTFRNHLLACGELRERSLTKDDLGAATRVWFLNSVRGWLEVRPLSGA